MKKKQATKFLNAFAAIRILMRAATRIVNMIRGKKSKPVAPETSPDDDPTPNDTTAAG